MRDIIPVFIGYDTRETVAWHVLVASLIENTREPLAITPIGNSTLSPEVWDRPKGPYDSTEFSNARFLVPFLMRFKGWAIFMDCDMLATADIGALWKQRDDRYAVMVRKHRHEPQATRKFLGAEQTRYPRKNWSSLMLMNCAHPDARNLTQKAVNNLPGLDLHGFAWTDNIGEIDGDWNYLVEDGKRIPDRTPPLIHFTEGGPWHGYVRNPYAGAWAETLDGILCGANPRADSTGRLGSGMAGDCLEAGVRFSLSGC